MKTSTESHDRIVRMFGSNLVEEMPENTPNTVSRVNKKGRTVHELFYAKIEGKIAWIETRVGKYGEDLEITLVDDESEAGKFILPFSSRQSYSFLKRMLNIDFTKEVEFEVWDNDYEHPFLAVSQEGELVANKFDRDQLPEWVAVQVNNETKYDRTEFDKFLKEQIAYVQSMLGKAGQVDQRENKKRVDAEAVAEVNDMPWDTAEGDAF